MRSKRAEGPGERRAVRGGPFKNIEVEHPARLLETREEESERGTERNCSGATAWKAYAIACVRACVHTSVRAKLFFVLENRRVGIRKDSTVS